MMVRFLFASLVLLCCISSWALAQERRPATKSLGKMQRQLENIRDKGATVRKELRTTRRQINVVVEDIRRVDQRLDHVEERLADTSERLVSSKQEQRRAALDLQEATQLLAESRQQLRHRLRAQYVRGQGSLLSVLVGTSSVGDLASRKHLMERIAAKDRRLLDRHSSLRNQVANRKAQKDRSVRRVQGLLVDQRRQQDTLEDVRKEKRETVSALQTRQAQLRRLLSEYEAAERAVESRIRAFLARQRRPSAGPIPQFRGRFIRPVLGRITSGFGQRFHPILRIRRLHAGIDIAARFGTPIVASAAGEVIEAAYMGGYGNTVIIDHGSGISTVYAHCSRIFVHRGQRVRQGQRIAAVGSTGLSTGPHLHFEIRVNGRPINPAGRL